MMLKIYQERFGLPVNFTRAANVYGPGQQLYRIIPRTILACLTGQKLVLDGGGISERAFIHIDDVSSATLSIAQSKVNGETFHISTDEFVSIKGLVQKIVDMTGANFDAVVTIGEERLGKDQAYFLDSAKIRTVFNWTDTISLEQGVEETISWLEIIWTCCRQRRLVMFTNPEPAIEKNLDEISASLALALSRLP